jgi:hypothetical protein
MAVNYFCTDGAFYMRYDRSDDTWLIRQWDISVRSKRVMEVSISRLHMRVVLLRLGVI